MASRSLTSAIRPLSSFNALLRTPYMAFGGRQFSSTPAFGLKAVFTPTENAELNAALNKIQETIILPAYLPQKQREIIFDPKKKAHLQQNPVVIELDGLEHRFSSIDRFKDVQESKQALIEAMNLMKTREDWENMGTLLAGYLKAGIRLPVGLFAKVIRTAGHQGHPYAIIECAKQSQKTGLALDRKEFVAQLLIRINDRIVAGEADGAAQAFTWTQILLDMLQRPEHMMDVKPVHRLHMTPSIRGVVLFTEASAAKAKLDAGLPADEELAAVKTSVELIQAAWARPCSVNRADTLSFTELNPHIRSNTHKKYDPALGATDYVTVIAEIIRGMELARDLLGDAASGLAPLEQELEEHLPIFVSKKKRPSTQWSDAYEKVLGRKASWAPAKTEEA